MATRPDSADLKYIRLRKNEVIVEYRDDTRFYDTNPEDKKHQVDYYIEGRKPGEKPIIVLSQHAPKALLEHLKKTPLPIRPERASKQEESHARIFFRRGHKFSQEVTGIFTEKVANWDDSIELVMNELGSFSFEYLDKMGRKHIATVSVQTKRNADGTLEHRFFEVRLNVNRIILIDKRRDVLDVVQDRLHATYDKLFKAYWDAKKKSQNQMAPL